MHILVTGGTGRLGRPTVTTLRERGHRVCILSRHPGPDHAVADLASGAGLDEALTGIDAVLHLATTRSKDIRQTQELLSALTGRGIPLTFISIVGVDRIPFAYYRDKLASERAIETSLVPHTIIRVAQFHGFVEEILDAQRRLPVTIAIPASLQTIDMTDVATRLADLVEGGAQGRVADLGGPEQLSFADYARCWQAAHGIRRPIWTLPALGGFLRALRAGHLMPGLPGAGRITFAEYLNQR